MEYGRSFWLLMGILLLLRPAAAQNKTDIPRHVNLSPFWGWISAQECLLKYQITSDCKGTEVLTLSGAIYVDQNDTADYCKAHACGDRTKDVLDCIHSVKRDFKFSNKAKVQYIANAITEGCNSHSAINTTVYTSSATKFYSSSSILFLSTAAFMILLMSMNM